MGHKIDTDYKSNKHILYIEMRQVPAYYKQFLLIETPRSDHMLEASNFMMEICLPSVSGNFMY